MSVAVPINDASTVNVTANVDATLTFDLDVSASQGDSNGPYVVALGTLSAATLTTSNQSSINSIMVDLDTNASGGAVVTVKGLNQGLLSTAANPDKTIALGSNEETIAAGSEEIGLCVESVASTVGTLLIGTQYDSGGSVTNCTTTNGGTPTVGKIVNNVQQILNTNSAAMAAGRAEILVKASITATTPAANDYTETLTFIATGTF